MITLYKNTLKTPLLNQLIISQIHKKWMTLFQINIKQVQIEKRITIVNQIMSKNR